MRLNKPLSCGLFLLLCAMPALATETVDDRASLLARPRASLAEQNAALSNVVFVPAGAASQNTSSSGFNSLIDKGMSFIGIKYRFGGDGPEDGGFDCSGLVRKVFGDALGLSLPRRAAEMAKEGDKVARRELKPGDLVFFNTMRRTFSHVGIYVGDNKFLHAPSKGGQVRVESMDSAYWQKRFTGARRVTDDAAVAQSPQASTAGTRYTTP